MNEDRLTRSMMFAVLLLFGLCLAGIMLWVCRQLLSPVITGLLIAYLIFPIVRGGARLGIPKVVIVLAIIASLVAGIFVTIYRFVPQVKSEIEILTKLSDTQKEPGDHEEFTSEAQSKLVTTVRLLHAQLKQYGLVSTDLQDTEIVNAISGWLANSTASLVRGATDLAVRSSQFTLVFLFVLVFSLLDGGKLYKTIIDLVPNSHLETGIFILNKTERILGNYLRGLAVETVLLFFVAVALLMMAVPHTKITVVMALMVALILALTNIVRIIGPIFGGFASGIIVAIQVTDLPSIAVVAAVAILVQVADNVLVLPLVMREQVDIHPVITMLGILSGGMLAGVLGMVLAIPVIAGFKVIYRVVAVEIKRYDANSAENFAAHDDLWTDGRHLTGGRVMNDTM